MPRPRPKPNSTPDDLAFGINACSMALDAGYAKSLLYFAETKNERVFELVEKAKDKGIAAQPVDVFRLDQLSGEGVHQGVLVRLRDVEPVDLRQVARDAGKSSLIIILDRVTDPRTWAPCCARPSPSALARWCYRCGEGRC
ncbi:MAG: hypothetical protein IPI85_09510 [Dehalococcoidia bacterium]|nr:hypothetical protein [Dehalococcoidia bacterium]